MFIVIWLAFFVFSLHTSIHPTENTPAHLRMEKFPSFEQKFPNSESPEKNWDVFADFLFWHAAEVGMIPNSIIAVTSNQNILTTELDLRNLNFHWDLGFRVGGSYSDIGHDQWNLSLYYTWYKTEAKNSGSYPGFVGFPSGFPLTGTLSDADFLSLSCLFAAKSYQAKWNLRYHIFDLEADHEFTASQTLSFRPYLGLRGGWIH